MVKCLVQLQYILVNTWTMIGCLGFKMPMWCKPAYTKPCLLPAWPSTKLSAWTAAAQNCEDKCLSRETQPLRESTGHPTELFDNANTPKVFNPQGSKHLQFLASPIVFVFLEYHLYQKASSKPTSFRHNSNNNTNKEPGDTMMRRPAVATSQESPQSWMSSEFQ